MGAGLGGGSADAAWTLRMLDQIFHLELPPARLAAYAATLGSDCAFFLHDKPMLGSGRGEILSDVAVDLKGKFIVLVKPAVHVATAEAYGGIVPRPVVKDLKQGLEQLPIEQWRTQVMNDFEDSIFQRYPAIAAVKDMLYNCGAAYASMSGSGATVYGIFQQPVHLEERFPGMMYWSGIL
jgi:4-diphosphocytidyl-2-C-methyl-D-erythritol kinase